MCTYFVLNKYYYIIILYGGSHASDILHVLMGVSVAKLIIYQSINQSINQSMLFIPEYSIHIQIMLSHSYAIKKINKLVCMYI